MIVKCFHNIFWFLSKLCDIWLFFDANFYSIWWFLTVRVARTLKQYFPFLYAFIYK